MSGIVIEGIDGSGKSTIARYLESRRGWQYLHQGLPKTDRPALEYLNALAEVDEAKPFVSDRLHLGEPVYSMNDPKRMKSGITPAEHAAVEAKLLDLEARLLYLDVDPAECQRRVKANGDRATVGDPNHPPDWEWPLERFEKLAADYQHVLETCKLPRIDKEDVVDYAAGVVCTASPDPEGSGTRTPLIWILGEQESSKTPAPGPLLTRCGFELIWPEVDIQLHRVSNALAPTADLEQARHGQPDYDVLQHLWARWMNLGRPRVIALGATAGKLCLAAGVPVLVELSHPQHWLRFHAKEPEAYRAQLKSWLTGVPV